MKSNLKKYCCLITLVVISTILIFVEYASSNNNSYQTSDIETTSSSGQFSIPACSSCDVVSEPTCSGNTSPKCSVDEDKPNCQLVGDTCTPRCLGTILDPNTGFPVPATPFCSTKYFFVDGPGAGIQIYSEGDNPLKIYFATNSTTFANGTIKEPDTNCPGPNSHFNGDILNFSDSDPTGCGWGHVVIFKKLPERLSLLSDIITNTKDASYNVQTFFAGSFGDALTLTNASLSDLQTLQNSISRSKDIKSRNKRTIIKKIKTTVKENQIARTNLLQLVDKIKNTEMTDADLLKRDAAITALSKAYDSEAEILIILLKFDVLQ